MATGTRTLVAICVLGGGGGIPWLLHKTNLLSNSTNLSSSSPETSVSALPAKPSTAPQKLENPPQPPEKLTTQLHVLPEKINEGNCSVKEKLEDLEYLLWDREDAVNVDTFIRVSCSNTNSDHDSPMPNEWSGLFPNTLFKNRREVTKGRKIEIKTETSGDSTKYQTTFSGSHFYEKIEGEWNNSSKDETEEKVTEVKINHSRPPAETIFLLFKKQQ